MAGKIEPPVIVVVASGAGSRVDDLVIAEHFFEEVAGALDGAVFVCGKVVHGEGIRAKVRQAIQQTEVFEDDRVRAAVSEFDDADGNIRPAVVVKVLNFHMRCLEGKRNESRRDGDVLKRRNAVPDSAVKVEAVGDRLLPRRFKVLADDNIGQSVTVHIAKTNAADHVVAARVFPCEDITRAGRFAKVAATIVEKKDISR